jgi:hypothetical protein
MPVYKLAQAIQLADTQHRNSRQSPCVPVRFVDDPLDCIGVMPRRPERPGDRTRTGTADNIGFETKSIESAYGANVCIAMLAAATQTHGKLWNLIDLLARIIESQRLR